MAKQIKTLAQIAPQILQIGQAAASDPKFTLTIHFTNFRSALIFRDAFYNSRLFLAKQPKEILLGHLSTILRGLNNLSMSRVSKSEYDHSMATLGYFPLRIYPLTERFQTPDFASLSDQLAAIQLPDDLLAQIHGQMPPTQSAQPYRPLPDSAPTTVSLSELHQMPEQGDPLLWTNGITTLPFANDTYSERCFKLLQKSFAHTTTAERLSCYKVFCSFLPKTLFTDKPTIDSSLVQYLPEGIEADIIVDMAFAALSMANEADR